MTLVPGLLAIAAGVGLTAWGCKRSRRCAALRERLGRRLSTSRVTSRLTPRAQQYQRYQQQIEPHLALA